MGIGSWLVAIACGFDWDSSDIWIDWKRACQLECFDVDIDSDDDDDDAKQWSS